MAIDLNKLEEQLDNALAEETTETLTKFLDEQAKKDAEEIKDLQ